MNSLQISEFFGIQQQKDGSLLPAGSAYDCRNMVTLDGNLSVAKGYRKHIFAQIPGSERILKLIVGRGAEPQFIVVTIAHIYRYNGAAWDDLHTFSPALTSTQVDYLQTQIGTDDYIVVSTGQTQMQKIKLSDGTCADFGTGALSFEGTVSAYDSAGKVVTLSGTLTAEAQRHAPLDGITIAGTWHEVASATSTSVTLSDTPDTAPTSGAAATIRGGGNHPGRRLRCALRVPRPVLRPPVRRGRPGRAVQALLVCGQRRRTHD